VTIGSHSESHVPLPTLGATDLERSLAGSRGELRRRLGIHCSLLAYPHGRHDEAVRSAARSAGYDLAYTTEPGRNGAGTPRYALRRVGVKDWDTRASFLFKVLTGRPVPYRWDRRLQARWRGRDRRPP
jgi:peptidoglycan/xylan/chitin deacetylase (PgdA/CDA1 family)